MTFNIETEFPVTITITDNWSSKKVSFEDALSFAEGEPSYWVWQEGNFACDCNRGLFFARALGEDEALWDTECGIVRYRVAIEDIDGNLLYEDE